jgi:LmbE family N-acetylglucosaminyl deacetylase
MDPRNPSLGSFGPGALGTALTLGVLLTPLTGFAQQPPRQPSAGELLRAIERLSVVGNVLYVAAHPDDENTRLLAYLNGERLLRTAYLSLTRGDGGQNLIGAEQGPLLGLIRTQELLAARRIDGAEQFFTRARDFGYSKTPAETLSIWNRGAVLADLVWVIRALKPDVIITRFPTQGLDTHGHHTASAVLAGEAFKAAADPAFAPEQLPHVGVWQARRLFWNRSPWGRLANDDLSGFLKLDIGVYNPLLGMSYGEIAADSRSMHKSQGFGSAKNRGPMLEYFQPLAGDAQPPGLLDGIDLTWGRVKGGARLAQLLKQAAHEFDPRHPEAVIPTLLKARAELAQLPPSPWKEPKLRELNEVLGACVGLFVEVSASDYAVTAGGPLGLTVVAQNRSPAALRLRELRLPGGVTVAVDKPLGLGAPVQLEKTIQVPAGTPISNPYWLSEAPEKGLYPVRDPLLIGLPETPSPLVAELQLELPGPAGKPEPLVVRRPVLYKWTDPVAGERQRALEVTPAVMINPEAAVLMFPDDKAKLLRVRLKAGREKVAGTVRLELPPGFHAEPAELPFQLADKGAEEEVRFQLTPPAAATTVRGTLRVVAEVGGERSSRGLVRIDYPHIPIQTLFPESTVTLCRFELAKTRTRIGYIAGAGDEVPAALRQVGYEVTLLDEEAILRQPLSRFGAIVVGVRAYNTNPRLPYYHQRLMDFVAAGGNLVVQYSTSNRLGKLQTPIGPYPFEISYDRVTDENAAVTVTLPSHGLLQRPNRISEADFAGWVQERGLYFADKLSDKYETPLSMHDPDEPPSKGSLIFTRFGKGAFIYTGLAFFRQLPAGVPGAYRLFGNLLSYEP